MTDSEVRRVRSPKRTLLVVGCGSLGSSMISACLSSGIIQKEGCTFIERDSKRRSEAASSFGCRAEEFPGEYVRDFESVALVVKPQEAEAVCRALSPFLRSSQLILSVMAGVSTQSLQLWLNKHRTIVRAMPNLPARFQEGVSALFCPPEVLPAAQAAAEEILHSFGRVIRVDSELLVDAATAVSGTGPAYFFYLVEQLELVAQEFGFSREQATALVRTTMRGSARMLLEDSDSAARMRERVTSKGGTTEAAFRVLEGAGVGERFQEAIRSAFMCARQMSAGKSEP